MTRQTQFLNVIAKEEALRRFESALEARPLGFESVGIDQSLGRILALDVISETNVPYFDRSNFDGFAVAAKAVLGASENHPVELDLRAETISAGVCPEIELAESESVSISTGGMIPRGANAVCLIENTELDSAHRKLIIRKGVFPGSGITFTGTDISCGETILRAGQNLTSRETGVLAAIGRTSVDVFMRPTVAVISTGNEIIAPGEMISPGLVFDSNARMISDAVREAGGLPVEMGIAIDDLPVLQDIVRQALKTCDMVVLSGGTSKGEGDLSYQVVSKLDDPGIVAHGVALKPGKPVCLAVTGEPKKPVVILPGFPTSAIFTFHEFVKPILQRYAGKHISTESTCEARLATKVTSEIGRTEYLLVRLTRNTESEPQGRDSDALRAYPMGKGSGSVTAFSQADGFISIDRQTELIDQGSRVKVQLLGRDLRAPDLVVIGSHCVGLDLLLSEIQKLGFQTKFIAVGSTGGVNAIRDGDSDIAGIHLPDPDSNTYNQSFVPKGVQLIHGYSRMQGIVYRNGDVRFENQNAHTAFQKIAGVNDCLMINRNPGSGTRILLDSYLERLTIESASLNGYEVQASNHHAVCAAVLQNRADWGIAVESAVEKSEKQKLGFIPIEEEKFDFLIPDSKLEKASVRAFLELLKNHSIHARLQSLKLTIDNRHL